METAAQGPRRERSSKAGRLDARRLTAGALAFLLIASGPGRAASAENESARGHEAEISAPARANAGDAPRDAAPSAEQALSPALKIALPLSLVGATFLLDRSIHREVNKTQTGTMAKLFDQGEFGRSGSVVEMMGEPQTTLGLAALFYGGGALFHSDRAKRTAIAGTEATLASGALVLGLKWMVGRDRPYDKNDFDEFRPFHGTKTRNASFPSGHSITAFSMAAVVSDQYPNLAVGVLSYGAASLVGISRVYQDRHWASDVVAGAILGILVGKGISRRTTRNGGKWAFATDGRSLTLTRRF